MAISTENKRIETQLECLVKVDEIAKLIGKSVRRVQQLTQEGVFRVVDVKNGKRTSKRYDKYETVQKYIEYTVNKTEEKGGKDKEDEKLQVEIDIKKTKLKMEQLKLNELEGNMHAAEDVENMTTDLVMCVRSNLLAMPGRLAVELAAIDNAAEISAVIHKTVCDVLNELANYSYDPEEYRKRVRERQGWLDDEQRESEE